MSERRDNSRDRFFVVLVGLISYGIILIAIVIGTFFLVRNSFNKHDAMVSEAVAGDTAVNTEEKNEEADMGDMAEPEPVSEEEPEISHDVEADKYLSEGKLDYSKEIFKPNERDISLKWDDTVFSRIENVREPDKAAVNTYELVNKRIKLVDDRLLELLIYKNPDTGKIEKITAIEHCADNYNVIDYYYNNGSINYAAQRAELIDYPIDISSGKVTSRFYFCKDTLVRYSYCEDDKATIFNASSLAEYSEGTVGQYEYLESEMINKAYITLNAAESIESRQYIEGYILDEYDQALVDVGVKLLKSDDLSEAASAITDGDGHYEMSIPSDDEGTYILSATKDEFDEARVYGISAKSASGVYFVPTPRLTYASDGAEYNEQIAVRDSVSNDLPLSDASISLRAGLNCREGDVIASGTLDQAGNTVFTLQSGNYTAHVSKGGYEDSYFNVIVTMAKQITVGYAVADVPEGKIETVLAWDSAPLDLEARIITSGGRDVKKAVSDGTGALTTETIILDTKEGEVYRYYVSDYTNCMANDPNSDSMTSSGARVALYGSEGFITSYDVPMGHLGVVWEPLMIRNNMVIPVNRYYNVIEPDSYWTSK